MEINYNSAAALKAFLEQEGLGMRKKFGQNFLINHETRERLADALGAAAGEPVWEIGPGLGAMTRLLLDRGLLVRAFEIDSGFIRILEELFGGEKNFSLVRGDVLKTWRGEAVCEEAAYEAPAEADHKTLPETTGSKTYLLGNLPYNIAAALLADLIEKGRLFSRIVVTVQKEVALRMAAKAGSAEYSSFSVLCSSVYTVKPLMLIKGSSFYPRPNVDSQGLLLEQRKDAGPENYPALFYPQVRQLFSSRRKMIKNNLLGFLAARPGAGEKSGSLGAEILDKSGLSGNERAENLKLEDFLTLAKTVENMENYKDVNSRKH
jgi:16S rRNA (adenine1518-N6/adenine1519-N6)-dimethyltransferase